ncbi:MAG: hypothetical protein Q7S33_05135 [Nanoarchaeota archaeon]|nr:hypothetical protein [Nanoarchaeota archaeon]
METKENIIEILIIIFASIILGLAVSFFEKSFSTILLTIICFLIIISLNVLAKKSMAYYFETDVTTRLWSLYQFGFTKSGHFKKALPMFWLPLFISFLSKGLFFWLAILEFDFKPRTERVSRRHGLYRFTEVSEWHMAVIASAGIIINLFFAIIGYLASGYIQGAEIFAQLSIYYAFWSIIPISSLDGSRILFGSRILWIAMIAITTIFLGYSMVII